MITQNHVSISDDVSGLKRSVDWTKFVIDKLNKQIQVVTFLHFYQPNVNESDGYGQKFKISFERSLFASNVRTVNQVGEVVTRVDNGDGTFGPWLNNSGVEATQTFGQFDFFENVAKNIPSLVYPYIASIIQIEDSEYHTYNSFSPYEN